MIRWVDIAPLQDEWAQAAIRLWTEVGLTRPWNDPAADLERARSAPASTVLACRADGALVGTAMVGFDGHRGWVYYLAVAPTHQRQGVGRALMAACEARLREQGAPKLELMIRKDNAGIAAFYQRLGYVEEDVRVLSRRLDAPAELA